MLLPRLKLYTLSHTYALYLHTSQYSRKKMCVNIVHNFMQAQEFS